MPLLQALLECVGQSLCEQGRKALRGQWSYSDVLQDVCRAAYDHAHRKLPGTDLSHALAQAAACPEHEYERRLGELIADLSLTHSVPKEALSDYLRALPVAIRQILRRPSDPEGRTAPEGMTFYRAEDLLAFLPPRPAQFRPGDRPEGLDGWTLTELRGLGECSEVWRADDPARPDESPAALKFAIDPETGDRVRAGTELFTQVFGLHSIQGILPLRSVYLESKPPGLDMPFVYGYDLAGLMLEWRWRYDHAKPEAALKLIRRLTSIIAEAHNAGVIHRDLKPSNVLLHPTDGGKKFTMWVTDFGWGQIESVRSLELAWLGPRADQVRLAERGASTVLYASPQQARKEPVSLADDVHALGVIWYQLLKRNPSAAAPVGTEWVEEFRPHGFTDSQARVLQTCLATRPDKRQKNAMQLAEQLAEVTVGSSSSSDGSKLISLKNPSSTIQTPIVATAGGRAFDVDATAAQAAALLGAAGSPGPLGVASPLAATSVKAVKNSIGMTFIRIPAGSFEMGSADTETGHRPHEGPPHHVKITRAFYLATHPVTQAQYERVIGKNPAKYNRGRGGGSEHPVEMVSWKEAEAFCILLAQLPEEQIHGRSYRLPSEAEWEYACRGGTTTAFSFGDRVTPEDALTAAGTGKYAGKSTAPIGKFPANSFGLYDMHGNVQEWVSDWYEEYYYFDCPSDDPPGPGHGALKVARGGSWHMLPAEARSAARRPYSAETRLDTLGFRVALVVG
jgi:formylglycine-generating enzyme required for sulfatase activity